MLHRYRREPLSSKALISTPRPRPLWSAAALAALLAPALLAAQELTPRAYWPAPAGTRLLSFGYGYSTGDVLLDPALPIEDVDAQTHTLSLNYLQFFALAGRTASVTIELPTAVSSYDFALLGDPQRRSLSGFADLKLRLAINLSGAPSLTPAEFQAYREAPRDIFGASLRIQAPTGAYDSRRPANLGTNRWAFKPELGYLHPFGDRWVAEVDAGVWLYTDNDDSLGQRVEQDPLASVELHLVRRLKPGLWASFDINGFYGGRTTTDGTDGDNRQKNSRIGLTVVYPPARRHALKLAFSTGLTTEAGGDFETAILGYSYAF